LQPQIREYYSGECMKKFLGIALALVFTMNAGSVLAQTSAGQGAVAGNVTDATKAVIPQAHVVLSNPGIGFKAETNTNAEGHYSFSSLTVTEGYTVTVTTKGFATEKVENVTTSVGTVITENVILSVGSESTLVEVQAGAVEQVQTDTSSISQLIDKTVWEESPLAVRDSNSFVGLVAGAAGDSAGTGRGFAVNGARTGTGDFVVEGFDDNDQGLGGPAIATMSPDAIQEYRVVTSVPNAEYGRAGGFATDTVLKSGTKKWHGSAFDYNRIQALAQQNWFNSFNSPKLIDHLVRNQFGGSIGGPVYKDRTFFYATAEFQRQRQGAPTTYVAETQDFYNFVKSGAFEKWAEGTAQQNPTVNADGFVGVGFCPANLGRTCPGGFADAATTAPIFNKNYAAVPTEFPFATDSFTNEFSDLYLGGQYSAAAVPLYAPVNVFGNGHTINSQVFNQNRGSLKLDHKLTERDQLSFTYVLDLNNETDSIGGGESTPGLPEVAVGGGQLFGARWTHTFTPNFLTEAKANYTRHVNNINAGGPQGVPGQFTNDALYTGFGVNTGLPQLFTENEFVYSGSATYTHHAHTFKAGGGFTRTRNGSSFYNDQYGTLAFYSTPGLMTDGLFEHDAGVLTGQESTYGDLYYATASQDPSTSSAPNPYRGYRANEFNAYIQDDWKATPRLFINYGIRWDYFGPPHNAQAGFDSNVYFGSASTVTTANPFAPGNSLYLGEQSASFRCVGSNPCGNPNAATAAGYALASGSSTIWDRDVNNFAPRVGFSYDTLGNGKFVVRGGFGIGYDRLYNNVYENIRFNAPHFVDNVTGFGEGSAPISNALRAGLVTSPFTGNNLLSGAGAVPRHVNQHLKTAYYEQIHFGVETGVKGYVLEANYIGTLGRQLVGLMNANTFEGRVACSSAAQKAACSAAGLTAAQMSTARPNSTFSNDNFRTNGFSSNYSGGQVSVRKSFIGGLQVNANYTYSKAMDQISDVFTVKSGATGITTPYNPSHVYGPSDFDTRHLGKLTLNYQTHSSTHKLLLAGWGISPIATMRSGTPIFIKDSSSTYDPNKDGTTGVEPAVYKGTGSIKGSIIRGNSIAGINPGGTGNKGTGYIKLGSWGDYACPKSVNSGLFCDVPGDRQNLYGPRGYDLDVAVSKHIKLTERFAMTLQAAFFDVDGHPQWANPVGDINSSDFGNATSAGHREGQLSGRIDF
jgi:hypothetical protein